MNARRADFWIVVAAAAIVAFLGWQGNEATKAPPLSVYSTYDTGLNGYRALLGVLQAAGVPARRFTRVLGVLDPDVKTLVISGYETDPSAKPLDASDATILRDFVQRGGRLVVLDDDFEAAHDVTPGIGSSVPLQNPQSGAISLPDTPFTAGVKRVAGPIDAVFPFAERQGVPLLANRSGVVALAYRYGKGEVIAVTAPAIFGNAHLTTADNLPFAYDVIAGGGPVAFDEYVHGYDDDLSFWAVLPWPVHAAIWLLVAILLLAAIGANVPFAPPVPLEPPVQRDTSAYIDAMAALMRRGKGTA